MFIRKCLKGRKLNCISKKQNPSKSKRGSEFSIPKSKKCLPFPLCSCKLTCRASHSYLPSAGPHSSRQQPGFDRTTTTALPGKGLTARKAEVFASATWGQLPAVPPKGRPAGRTYDPTSCSWPSASRKRPMGVRLSPMVSILLVSLFLMLRSRIEAWMNTSMMGSRIPKRKTMTDPSM